MRRRRPSAGRSARWWTCARRRPAAPAAARWAGRGPVAELTRASLVTPSPAQRERVDLAVRDVASGVAEQLPQRWGDSVRASTAPDVDELAGALDAAVNEVDLTVRRPCGGRRCACSSTCSSRARSSASCGSWCSACCAGRGRPGPTRRSSAPCRCRRCCSLGGLLLGALLGWVASSLVRRGARRRRSEAVDELRAAVGEVAWQRVVAPIAEVLIEHRSAREALASRSDLASFRSRVTP